MYRRSLVILANTVVCLQLATLIQTHGGQKKCRVQPGDSDFPSIADWNLLNITTQGRLLAVVPSAAYCSHLNCTEDQWTNTTFRLQIPGQMIAYCFEQDYESTPPSLCLRNGTECAQGNVPIYAINATQPSHIRAGIQFASKNNLKLVIKSTGHDLLGRSTAKGSLLLWTHYFRDMSFTDSFSVGGRDLGSAVTVGSGVTLDELYSKCGERGKFVVAGNSRTVAAAGGFIQGGGHSSFSPVFGLAVDNVLQFEIVLADGSFVTANEQSHSDLFWALRGGGAGSWGVITSATFQTFPTFTASRYDTTIIVPTNADAGALVRIYARHIFDLEQSRASQYLFMTNASLVPILGEGRTGVVFTVFAFFKDLVGDQASALIKPLLDELAEAGQGRWQILPENVITAKVHEVVFESPDNGGTMAILGTRLIPERVYRNDVDEIGRTYEELLGEGVPQIISLGVGGGKVHENININVSANPKWRTAKTLMYVSASWNERTTPARVEEIKQTLTNKWVPKLVALTGEQDSGTYSNEADVREPNFQQTFFGVNYARLKEIKRKYDPEELFIVPAGVGSENWEFGLCRH